MEVAPSRSCDAYRIDLNLFKEIMNLLKQYHKLYCLPALSINVQPRYWVKHVIKLVGRKGVRK